MRRNRISLIAAAIAGAISITAAPAMAGNPDGRVQVKLMVTGVLPDGKVSAVYYDRIPLPPGTTSSASNNVVPTAAIEYFATPNLSIETICCVTKHKVYGRGAVYGTELLTRGHIVPATVTLKYHIPVGAVVRPYVGAGPTAVFFIGEKPGADLRALGADKVSLKTSFGAALQAGVDVPIGKSGLGLSLDAKRYFVKSTLRVKDAAGDEILRTRHKLDPWLLSAGVSYRF